jgi:transposase
LSEIREDENGDSRNWGKRGNKKLHRWEFDRFTNLLEYKAEENGTPVDRKTERNANRVKRGLCVCESCGATMNADVNGEVNIRRQITQNPPTEDMSHGRLAQPLAYPFNQTSGSFRPREQVGCESSYPNARESSPTAGRMSSVTNRITNCDIPVAQESLSSLC